MAGRPWRDVLRDHHAAGRQAGSAPRGPGAHAEAATAPAGAGRRTTAGRHPEPHQPLVRLAFRMAQAGDDHARDGWAIEELSRRPTTSVPMGHRGVEPRTSRSLNGWYTCGLDDGRRRDLPEVSSHV